MKEKVKPKKVRYEFFNDALESVNTSLLVVVADKVSSVTFLCIKLKKF